MDDFPDKFGDALNAGLLGSADLDAIIYSSADGDDNHDLAAAAAAGHMAQHQHQALLVQPYGAADPSAVLQHQQYLHQGYQHQEYHYQLSLQQQHQLGLGAFAVAAAGQAPVHAGAPLLHAQQAHAPPTYGYINGTLVVLHNPQHQHQQAYACNQGVPMPPPPPPPPPPPQQQLPLPPQYGAAATVSVKPTARAAQAGDFLTLARPKGGHGKTGRGNPLLARPPAKKYRAVPAAPAAPVAPAPVAPIAPIAVAATAVGTAGPSNAIVAVAAAAAGPPAGAAGTADALKCALDKLKAARKEKTGKEGPAIQELAVLVPDVGERVRLLLSIKMTLTNKLLSLDSAAQDKALLRKAENRDSAHASRKRKAAYDKQMTATAVRLCALARAARQARGKQGADEEVAHLRTQRRAIIAPHEAMGRLTMKNWWPSESTNADAGAGGGAPAG